jgi:hypothetical protein
VPTIDIPVTAIRIDEDKPNKNWGAPSQLPLGPVSEHRILLKVPLDRVPLDGAISSALLLSFADRAVAAGKNLQVRDITESWKSSVNWPGPNVGSVLDTESTLATAEGQALPALDVTAWAVTRSRNGLRLESTSAAPAWWVRGSSGGAAQPVLRVTYTVKGDPPGNLRPDGGTVSVPTPVLSYAGDPDMTLQRIQYSPTGSESNITFDSGWVAATEGRYNPALTAGSEPVLTNGGAGVYWRAVTDGPGGPTVASDWAFYKYAALPTVAVTNPVFPVMTNLFPNPTFAGVTGGSVEVDRNLFPNPSFETTNTGLLAYNGATTTRVTNVDAFIGGSYGRLTRGTAGAGLLGMLYYAGLGPSQPVSYQIRARLDPSHSVNSRDFTVSGQCYDGAGSGLGGATGGGATVTLTKSWQAFSVEGATTVSNAGTERFGIQITPATSMTATDAVDIDAVIVVNNASLPLDGYFAGDTAASADFTYAWAGAAHNSESQRLGRIVTVVSSSPSTNAVAYQRGNTVLAVKPSTISSAILFLPTGSAAPASPGQYFAYRAYVRVTAPNSNPVNISLSSGGYAGGSQTGTPTETLIVAMTPGSWQEISVPALNVIPATTDNFRPIIRKSGNVNWTTQHRLEIDYIMIERVDGPGAEAGPYFNGSTLDTPEYTYDWTGTANNSASTRTGTVAESDDGTPPLTWTVTGQVAWRADLRTGNRLLDEQKIVQDAVTRTWTPAAGVSVPGGSGRFTLEVKDNVTDRMVADGAPTSVIVTRDFVTVLNGWGTAIDTLDVTYDDPIPVATGTRALGTPDEVALVRDGVIVPLWAPDGTSYEGWAPGSAFFSGTAFTLRDYTAPPRSEPTYSVRTRVGGVVSSAGPVRQITAFTPSVWLVDPRTGDKVDVQGLGGLPAVEQETSESSILHLPINGGLVVEPKRRRLVRTTRYGTIEGIVLNEDADLLEEWALADSSLKYRLIFGKVNWSVIYGDYSPMDQFYHDECGDDRTAVSLNYWQRLTDI